MVTEINKTSFNLGSKRAWLSILENCLKHLGYSDSETQKVSWILEQQEILKTQKVSWILERQEILNQLRRVCNDFGDNDWPDDLHLGDVIEKHLAGHLYDVRLT